MLWGLAVCENNEEGGKTSYRLKFLLQTKFSNKFVYRLQKGKLCVVPTPKSSGLTDLVVSVHNAILKMMMVWHHPLRYGKVCWIQLGLLAGPSHKEHGKKEKKKRNYFHSKSCTN